MKKKKSIGKGRIPGHAENPVGIIKRTREVANVQIRVRNPLQKAEITIRKRKRRNVVVVENDHVPNPPVLPVQAAPDRIRDPTVNLNPSRDPSRIPRTVNIERKVAKVVKATTIENPRAKNRNPSIERNLDVTEMTPVPKRNIDPNPPNQTKTSLINAIVTAIVIAKLAANATKKWSQLLWRPTLHPPDKFSILPKTTLPQEYLTITT